MLMLGWIGALATAGAAVTSGAGAPGTAAVGAPTPPRFRDDSRAVVAGEAATAGAAGADVSRRPDGK